MPAAASTHKSSEGGKHTLLREEHLFLLVSIAIGVFAGVAVVGFRLSIEWLRAVLLRTGQPASALRTIAVPGVMGLLVAFLVLRFFPRVRGSGVNQTKAAVYIYDGLIPFRTVIGKFVTAALAIGSGQSLGPEDPSLQVGAGLASALGRSLNLSRDRLRLIAPLGAAAGLAAAFNSPIAAVLFVIEEVIGRWSAATLGAIVLSAVSSTVVARWMLGGEPLFRVPAFELRDPAELLAYAVLGVVGGLASVVFLKLVLTLRPKLKAMPRWTQYLQPAIAGLLIGCIGARVPQVMGAGYDAMDQAMHGHFTWQMLGILAGLKILSTTVSFVSGTPGGLFAPTLFIGAMLGGAVGGAEQQLVPHLTGTVGAYALVGMGTTFAGILRAPMTSVFMVLEVSGNYGIILPVMISNTIAYVISRSLQPVPLFDVLTRQDGLELPSMEEQREETPLRVEDAMEPPESVEWLAKAQSVPGEDPPIDLLHLPHVHPDENLERVLGVLARHKVLPVVHRADTTRLLGVLRLEHTLERYRQQQREEEVARMPAGESL